MERRAWQIREALAFDDVLLEPAHSAVLPAEVDVRTRLTREIELGIPLISAAMDTVTEANLAIAMAQHGGLGILHRNLDPAAQADEVRKVKKFEAGMVVNPITLGPDASLADALELMAAQRISGIPVVEGEARRLVGILTNRDVRFATDPSVPVRQLMTAENLVTVRDGVDARAGQAAPAPAPDREAPGGRRRLPPDRPDDRQGHREIPDVPACLQGRARAAAGRRRDRGRPRRAGAGRGADRGGRGSPGGRHGARPFGARAGRARPDPPDQQRGADHRRQRRDAGWRQGADRRRRRCRQGRHRPGLDLHHPRGRGRRRAAARGAARHRGPLPSRRACR